MKNQTVEQEKNHGLEQAQAQLKSIKEMVKALQKTQENDNDEAIEEAETRIHEDALSVEMRSNWHTLGQEAEKGGEYKILLCWGGPAVQIVGELNEYNEPESAKIQYQDWFTSWTDHKIFKEDEEILLQYARCFYFGE